VAERSPKPAPVELVFVPPPAPPPVAQPAPERSSLAEETRLLREADRALRGGSAEAAISLLDEHAQRFPDGVLAPERSAERMVALCQLGKADAATASRFLASRSSSPLAARIRQACGVTR
jgi:RNA polymerase sigma-70 factor (ECF subfamily)